MLTAVENVQVPMFEGPLRPRGPREEGAELLKIVGMGHRANHLPQQLSVGERQRVAIARALANDPLVAAGRRTDRQSRLGVGQGHFRSCSPSCTASGA